MLARTCRVLAPALLLLALAGCGGGTTVVIAANARSTPAFEYDEGLGIARSIRDVPIGGEGL